MPERSIEDLLGNEGHATLLRFLAAAVEGLDESYLTPAERSAEAELEAAGLVGRREGRVFLEPAGRELAKKARERPAAPARPGSALESRIDFIQELTRGMTRSRNIADLTRSSFATLASVVPYDLAAAVILEQNIDVYVSRRAQLEDPLSDRFPGEIKRAMQKILDVEFGETDLLVRADYADLPARADVGDPYAHTVKTVLRQENRNAGVLVIFSESPLAPEAERLLEVLSGQISIVLGMIRTAERIENLADTDDLTGIWNKRWLRRQLPSEIDRSRIYNIPLSLAMFDIDDFKNINDTYGHVIGDVLLSELCGTVRETVRPPDTLARFGGDEFAVVLPHSDLYGARSVADRILQRARALRILAADGLTEVCCTVSIGIATYVPPMAAAELIQRADERLYESKRLGKNRVSW